MRYTLCLLIMLMLAACGGSKSSSGSGSGSGSSSDDDKWNSKDNSPEKGTHSNSANGSNSAAGNGSGGNDTASNKPKDPEPEPKPEPAVPQSTAWTNIEGKITVFNHVIALWDEVNHTVRFVACSQEIPADQIPRLRNGEPIESGEVPHIIFSFVLEEGTTTMTKAKVENWFYDFHWLTSLSPASLRNIGKETISEMTGKAKVGEMLKLVIAFESAKVKDAPSEKFDFEVNFDVKLQ